MTTLYTAESTSSWTSDDAVSTYTGFQREGTYCIGMQGSRGTVYAYKSISSTNLSNVVIYSWLNAGSVDTKANGGFRIVLGDGTNVRAYYVGGSDDYGFQLGAWNCFLLDTSNLPTNYHQIDGSSAPNLSAITQVGAEFNVPIKAVGSGDNCFIDICRYVSNSGYALTIGGGGVGTEGSFSQVEAQDNSTSNAWGVIRKLATGVYGIQAPIEFGNSGTGSSYFLDKNTIVIFEDRAVPSSFYKIKLTGNSTGTNSFVLGEKSGSVGIKGCTIKSAGSAKVSLNVSDSNFDEVKLYGCSFQDTGTITLPTFSANKECLNSSFDGCAKITASTMKLQYCKFISADDDAVTISSTSFGITDSDFIKPVNHGIEITSAGSYDFDDIKFYGTDGSSNYDIENTTTGTVIINNFNGSNTQYYDNSGGGSTQIKTATTISVHVEDKNGNSIQSAQVYIQKANPTHFTSDTGNNAGDADFVVNETVDSDIPQTGWLNIWNKAKNVVTPYRYQAWSGKTFTLRAEETGSCTTAGSSIQLIDSNADFGGTTDVKEGDTIRNTTDGSWAVVDEIVSSTELLTTPLQDGSDNTWQSGDGWSVNRLALTYTDNDDTVDIPLVNMQTDSSGNISKSYNYEGDVSIRVRIRSQSGAVKYLNYNTSGVITTNGYTLTAVLLKDEVS